MQHFSVLVSHILGGNLCGAYYFHTVVDVLNVQIFQETIRTSRVLFYIICTIYVLDYICNGPRLLINNPHRISRNDTDELMIIAVAK